MLQEKHVVKRRASSRLGEVLGSSIEGVCTNQVHRGDKGGICSGVCERKGETWGSIRGAALLEEPGLFHLEIQFMICIIIINYYYFCVLNLEHCLCYPWALTTEASFLCVADMEVCFPSFRRFQPVKLLLSFIFLLFTRVLVSWMEYTQ